jgi:hypothetical protein
MRTIRQQIEPSQAGGGEPMTIKEIASETRDVRDFERVVLRDYGELTVTQGDTESLTIEADGEVLESIHTEVKGGTLDIRIGAGWFDKLRHALETSFTRKPLRYALTVKTLEALDILGAARAKLDGVETERLTLVLGGAGEIRATSLTAEHLEVDIRGAGRVEVTGKVAAQSVTVEGAGLYDARNLASNRASIEIRGAGAATVSVEETLEVAIRGMGTVDYYGPPTVEKSIAGLGMVNHLERS